MAGTVSKIETHRIIHGNKIFRTRDREITRGCNKLWENNESWLKSSRGTKEKGSERAHLPEPKLVRVWRRDEAQSERESLTPCSFYQCCPLMWKLRLPNPPMQQQRVFALPPTFHTIPWQPPSYVCTLASERAKGKIRHVQIETATIPELPRNDLTSLEDSHLPNCDPVFILRWVLFRLHGPCMRNCTRVSDRSTLSTDDRTVSPSVSSSAQFDRVFSLWIGVYRYCESRLTKYSGGNYDLVY